MKGSQLFNFLPHAILAAAISIVLAGCGGGGGGGGVSTKPSVQVTGQAAVVTAAQSAVAYSSGLSQFGSLPLAKHSDASGNVVPLAVQAAEAAAAKFKPGSMMPHTSQTWTELVPGIWYEIVGETNTTAEFLLSTDDSTNNAGYIDLSVVGTVGTYPETILAKVDIILENQTLTGKETIVFFDDTGLDFTNTAVISVSPANVTYTVNLAGSNGQIEITSFAATKTDVMVGFSNIVANSSGMTANFSVGNVAGTVTVNPDGSGSAEAVDSTGTWTLTWDASQNATLTSPTGQVTTGPLSTLAA